MADIVRFRFDDRRAIDALYRRVFGYDAAEASRLRWHWQYVQNPNTPADGPQIWLAREGPTIVGQYATMPVRLALKGLEIKGSWGMDVMVAPERQRQGIGEVLFRTWDQSVDASLGLGLSASSHRLFKKMKWPEAGPVPCLIKPLTRRALRRPDWPMPLNRLVGGGDVPLRPARLEKQAAPGADRADPALRPAVHRAVGAHRDRRSACRSGGTRPT